MQRRFASIWFRYLTTDWLVIRHPTLKGVPFVFAAPEHGRMIITGASPEAEAHGVFRGMVVADAKAFVPGLQVYDDRPGLVDRLLKALGLWCIRYTPFVAVDFPEGLVLDISGCTHLWGGEREYLKALVYRLRNKGYNVRVAIADTIGGAWAVARFGKVMPLIASGEQGDAIRALPPQALRLEHHTVVKLKKLGFRTIGSFMGMPSSVLRRRFGDHILLRLRQALGQEEEFLQPLRPITPYEEWLPCLEPIRTAEGIEIAIQRLLETLCKRLAGEGNGLREATLSCHRIDGNIQQVSIGTHRSTAHIQHIFKLFSLKVSLIEPALGIELFVLQASKVEAVDAAQEILWSEPSGLEDTALAELLDRLSGRTGICTIQRFLPDEHHWPERSIKIASSIAEQAHTEWYLGRPRPTRLLFKPDPIEVSAPIPDYPPMNFRYKGVLHAIKRADGPERIEREWWADEGEHRDYYCVEDEVGRRYWLFRSGHYDDEIPQKWFIHGFFA